MVLLDILLDGIPAWRVERGQEAGPDAYQRQNLPW